MEHTHTEMSCGSQVPPLSPKYPWFVAQNFEAEDADTQVNIFYNLHEPVSHYRCQIPELLGNRIRGCFHGCWVLLSSNHPRDVMWSLWNTFTSKIINLPPLTHSGSSGDYCLSASPEHLNSVVLFTRTRKPNFVYCRLGRDSFSRTHKRKELRWIECTYAKQVRIITGRDGLLHCLTCCNGKVYAYIRPAYNNCRNILLVEVNIVVNYRKSKKSREVVITLLPILEFTRPTIFGCVDILMSLKGSSTELFNIVMGSNDEQETIAAVHVYKLDKDNMTWEEIGDIRDTILSVDFTVDSQLFYSPAVTSSEFGGYIHIVSDNGKIIYSYHVKDKTISLFSMPCLAGTNHVSAWAMPEWTRFEGVHVDCKQEQEGGKGDEMVVRSVKGNHVECEFRLKSDDADSKQENDKDADIIVRSVNGDEDESHLLSLPLHVLAMVMELSVGVDYLKFRSTCKRCHSATPLIQWNNGKASKRMQEHSLVSPWQIVFDKHKGSMTLTDPLFGDTYFIKTPQELICDFQIKCSRYGWLLILKPDRSLVLFNPFTSDIRELPRKFPQLPYLDIFTLSAPATSPDCMVVGMSYCVVDIFLCTHHVGREPSWRRISLNNRAGVKMFDSFTFYGRDLYVLRDDGALDVFEETCTESFSWLRNVAQAPTSRGTSFPQSFQMSCEQHVLRVIMGRFGESVEVFKLNDHTKEWVKKNGLGKHVIFICGTSSICIDAKTPQMKNKIYFLRSPIVYYSLETRRFHTFDNTNIQDSFGDLRGKKYHFTPHGWIEPSWSYNNNNKSRPVSNQNDDDDDDDLFNRFLRPYFST